MFPCFNEVLLTFKIFLFVVLLTVKSSVFLVLRFTTLCPWIDIWFYDFLLPYQNCRCRQTAFLYWQIKFHVFGPIHITAKLRQFTCLWAQTCNFWDVFVLLLIFEIQSVVD